MISLVAGVAVMLAAAAPVVDLRLTGPGLRSFPDGVPSKEGFAALEQEFGIGTVDSVLVVVAGDVTAAPVRAASPGS